ncbi:uncharacterized protein EI97DRAFT_31720 [Westerdykella ornata]|uniref:Uncharacterized protein n=1 Tax=Westerdykella ornata TaxID=318751 RepID=A0A6A6K2A2_WESOR|nr:uncharacterized protein EI97DRAFT_31720 [Westerdykella ornata]KAF2281519.1 hypothetical protein EI97DRAFT_31720 [Westerdykella ornata]
MERVPPSLRTASPTTARKTSVDQIPSALRVGSPIVEQGTTPMQQRPSSLRRQNTSGSERLVSQLFPSRPPSTISSASPDWPSSRRTSYPSPLVPAADTSYRPPRPPAPPSFPEDTSYVSSPDLFDQHHVPPLSRESSTKRILNRFTSFRSRGREYNKLKDEEGVQARGRLGEVEEVDEPIGCDISGYDSLPMQKFEPMRPKNTAGFAQQHGDVSEAGYAAQYAAEYHRLESQLGAGMSSIVEVPFTYKPEASQPIATHRRGPSSGAAVDFATGIAAQRKAEKTGDIVAVSEIPVDISETFGGTDIETRSVTSTNKNSGPGSKTSYYFPPDPDMPAWRPFSMGWPWLSMLVIIALFLAGLQEYLCQLSLKRSREDPEGGLIKFKKPQELSVAEYFTWKYAPVLFFVIYGIMWQVTDFEVKRLEPFYQLSKQTGATAGESLNMDYLTFMSWLVPLRALRHKQYAVIYVSLSTLVAGSLVPVLQSASVNVYPPKKERKTDDWKSIRIDPPWSRAVTACLIFVAICGCVLIYEMRRKSGLLSDPKGIAGVAAMATRSHILTDFQGLDTAPLHKIHKQLRHRRYILHKSSLWQGEYISSKEKIREHGTDPRPVMLRLRAGVPYICFIICFSVSIPIFIFVEGANKVTETLPWLLTALAILIKLLWGTMNCNIRMLEPFHILSRRYAPARTLTLDYTGTNPIFLPFKALLNKHYLVALVGWGSILAEILTVCVSSFSVDGKRFIPGHGVDDEDDGIDDSRANTDETFRSFWISFSLVMGILFALVCIACLVYVKRSHKFMPRQIGTIASVLAFIHQSKMLVTFVDTEKFNSWQMTRYLEKQGKTYGLGWYSGRDGDSYCGIDEEPILASYKYGVDFRDGRLLPNQAGSWQYLEG